MAVCCPPQFGPEEKISPTILWIAMKFSPNIRGSQRMNCHHFVDLTDFTSSTNMRLTFVTLSEISQQVLDGLPYSCPATLTCYDVEHGKQCTKHPHASIAIVNMFAYRH